MCISTASYCVSFSMCWWPPQSCSSQTNFSTTALYSTASRWERWPSVELKLSCFSAGFLLLQTAWGGTETSDKSDVRGLPQDRWAGCGMDCVDWIIFLASCNYWRWGSGGSQQNINSLCVLALNMINDKVFLIFWWWLYLLLAAGISRLIFRFFQTRSDQRLTYHWWNYIYCRRFRFLRFQMINLRMNRYFRRTSKLLKIESYIAQCKLGDW